MRYVPPEAYPARHPGRRGPMLVQQFIDSGDRVTVYRVLTRFSASPLYCQRMQSRHRASISAPPMR
ncbi:MAG: hypothetical protein WDM84_09025 [Bauldia sp.]